MVQQLLAEFEQQIEDITLIPGEGGVFEVEAGGELIYSKKATGRHATYDDVAEPLRKLIR
jgi:selenoprotein W-related protein